MKRFLCGLMMAMLMMVCAAQAMAFELQVSRADGVGGTVKVWEKSDGQHYLFLPAYMDGETLFLHYDDADSVTAGEMPLFNDCATDIICSGMKLMVKEDKRKESIIVMASRNLPAVHISTESGNLDYIHEKKGNKEKGNMMIVTAAGVVNFAQEVDQI